MEHRNTLAYRMVRELWYRSLTSRPKDNRAVLKHRTIKELFSYPTESGSEELSELSE